MPRPPEGEYYWHDLIGLSVINQDGRRLGEVKTITETGANDVLVIESGAGQRILIPLLKGIYVQDIDLAAGRIRVEWQLE